MCRPCGMWHEAQRKYVRGQNEQLNINKEDWFSGECPTEWYPKHMNELFLIYLL